jgi:outer membrane protein TolC
MTPRALLAVALSWSIFATCLPAQNLPPTINKAEVFVPVRDYLPPTVAPIRLTNTQRLYSLMRAGNLYLSAQDALALAIENNLNLEILRYVPQQAEVNYQRALAGGPLRGVPSGSSQISAVNAGVGVAGSTQSSGAGGNSGGGGGGGGGGNSQIQQIGAITPNLDPVLQSAMNFSHLTSPQSNTVVSGTTSIVDTTRVSNTVLQQGLLTGGNIAFRMYTQYLDENALSNYLNPVSAPRAELTLRQNLLRGFGIGLNNRGIRIADVNRAASRETFRSQLLNQVVGVLNLYWDYVGAREELKLRQRALAITEKFRDDTKYEISVGALSGVDLPRAEAELASRKQDVVIARNNVQQRAISLKEAISHTEDPALEAAEIIPTDRMPDPPEDESLPALREMVKTAMAKRPDVALAKFSEQTSEMNLAGTTNPLLPNLQVSFDTYNRGVAGTPQLSGGSPNQFFVGGFGTAMGQVFRRNFPSTSATVSFSATINNRSAQADYGIDQLTHRQGQLATQRNMNQIVVDVSSQMAALRQARARYITAKNTRILNEQLLEAEKKKSYGAATFNFIMVDQRALIASQLSEMNAISSYTRARISLDQVVGETLEKNNITIEEGLGGKVERESRPAEVIEQQQAQK